MAKIVIERRNHIKPGPNQIHDAWVKNQKRFRRRPARTFGPGFYNEQRLAQRASGIDPAKKPRVHETPASEANENMQHIFDTGTQADRAQLRKQFPKMFAPDGELKNRKAWSGPPVKKPKPKIYKSRLSGFPEHPGINLREAYRYGSAKERREMREMYPIYAGYFKSKEATVIAKGSEPTSPIEKKLEPRAGRGPTPQPGINIKSLYR